MGILSQQKSLSSTLSVAGEGHAGDRHSPGFSSQLLLVSLCSNFGFSGKYFNTSYAIIGILKTPHPPHPTDPPHPGRHSDGTANH